MLENLLEVGLSLLALLSNVFSLFFFFAACVTGHAGSQGILALLLHNPFDAFITPGEEFHSSPASSSNSIPELMHPAEPSGSCF